MRKVYQAADRIEAQLLMDCLADHQIPTHLHGDYLSGGAGELSALQFPTVWVTNNEDAGRVRSLLAACLQAKCGTAWQCHDCGEQLEASFDICWQCGTSRINTKI